MTRLVSSASAPELGRSVVVHPTGAAGDSTTVTTPPADGPTSGPDVANDELTIDPGEPRGAVRTAGG